MVREVPGQYRVVGGTQGKFSITTDPRSGPQVVEDLTGTRVDLPPIPPPPVKGTGSDPRPFPRMALNPL